MHQLIWQLVKVDDLGPTIRLAICGPIKPINEIAPATATATEDKITATKITLFSHVQL